MCCCVWFSGTLSPWDQQRSVPKFRPNRKKVRSHNNALVPSRFLLLSPQRLDNASCSYKKIVQVQFLRKQARDLQITTTCQALHHLATLDSTPTNVLIFKLFIDLGTTHLYWLFASKAGMDEKVVGSEFANGWYRKIMKLKNNLPNEFAYLFSTTNLLACRLFLNVLMWKCLVHANLRYFSILFQFLPEDLAMSFQ